MGINGTCTCFRYFVEKSASCAAVARWLGGGGGGGGKPAYVPIFVSIF